MQLFIEAFIVGIISTILFNILLIFEIKNISLQLFYTGIITHIFCEFTNLNKYYCTHGNACK